MNQNISSKKETNRRIPEVSGVQNHRDEHAIFLHALLRIGEGLLISGAEVFRVEDTLNRMGYAHGAVRMNVFVITSSVIVSMEMPSGEIYSQTRRIHKNIGTDLYRLEALNGISRAYCSHPCESALLWEVLDEISERRKNLYVETAGYIMAASGFCIFFGGNAADAAVSGLLGIGIWLMVLYVAPLCLNNLIFNFFASFVMGICICLTAHVFHLNMDKIMIGDIMLLIPGLSVTNAVRDLILGDILAGSMAFMNAVLTAGAIALGFIGAIMITGGVI